MHLFEIINLNKFSFCFFQNLPENTMATLSLKITLEGGTVTKTIQFDPQTTIFDACKIIRDKFAEAVNGQRKYRHFELRERVVALKTFIITINLCIMNECPIYSLRIWFVSLRRG